MAPEKEQRGGSDRPCTAQAEAKGQGVDTAAAPPVQKKPTGQSVTLEGAVEPAGQKEPGAAEQLLQLLAPVAEEKVPAGHREQLGAPAAL